MKFFQAMIYLIVTAFALYIGYNLVWGSILAHIQPVLFDCATGAAGSGCLTVDNSTIAQISSGNALITQNMNLIWFILGFGAIVYVIVAALRREKEEPAV